MGASSTFAHANITKSIIIGTSTLSLLLSGHKHYLDLPLSPHLTRDLQLWRILGHHFACSNSVDLFLIVILLWQISVPVERRFGSVKYASFLIVSIAVGTFFELFALIVNHHLFNYRAIPSGPFLLTFATLYQYHRIVPSLYDYKISRMTFDSNSLIPDLLSIILSCFNPTSSLIGLVVGAVYESDQFKLKRWRVKSSKILDNRTQGSGVRRPNHVALEDDPSV
ncbi:hypothetical protein BY996DRAFT_7547321 [Phakopsora pachyrhizi]|nr:hypothetical protein BY996DRAFT_7547321 [Phakopsora pachyrhizi]